MKRLLKPYNGWTLLVGTLGTLGFVLLICEADVPRVAVASKLVGLALVLMAALLGRMLVRKGKIDIDE